MPRYREPFTLYPRKTKRNKTVWYYRCYSPDGVRTSGKSTGQTSKTLARQYCQELIASGRLWTGQSVTFRQYAEHFFDDGSQWVMERTYKGERKFSPGTLKNYRGYLKFHLLPFFGRYKMSDIKPSVVKRFRLWLQDKELSNKTINNVVGTFSIIAKSAIADCIINFDPMLTVTKLGDDDKETIEAFTRGQVVAMFSDCWDDRNAELMALVAAVTGMRQAEVMAIRDETLFDNYIDVKDQRRREGLQKVKTKEARYVPIPKALADCLRANMTEDGWCFLRTDNYYRDAFNKWCGFSDRERMARSLRFHSLRHFANTDMLAHNITETKVRAVLGHSDGKGTMTERYTNWKPDMFPEVYRWQEELIEEIKKAREQIGKLSG